MHGHGKMTYDTGSVYEGEWHDGEKCGHGTLTSPDGTTYDGAWQDDKMHGHCTLTRADGCIIDVGEFKGGKRHRYSGHPVNPPPTKKQCVR